VAGRSSSGARRSRSACERRCGRSRWNCANDCTNPSRKPGRGCYSVLKGHLNYFAVSGNDPSLWWFFNQVKWHWLRSLRRRSQRAYLNWERYIRLINRFLPPIRWITRGWSENPLDCVTVPGREEITDLPTAFVQRRRRGHAADLAGLLGARKETMMPKPRLIPLNSWSQVRSMSGRRHR
jgi:hypothetical protein